jgi:hypothetical protein
MNFLTNSYNKKQHAVANCCDLRKAFDTVDHLILAIKLKKLGVHGAELKWFEDYLSNRQQFMSVNGTSSNLISILLGFLKDQFSVPCCFLYRLTTCPYAQNCYNFFSLMIQRSWPAIQT